MRYILFYIIILVFSSCDNGGKKSRPISKGEPGRLVLVSSDPLYNELNFVIDEVFLEPQPWLAQSEAYFRLSKMNTRSFGRSFIEHQTILFLITKDNYGELKAYLPEMEKADLIKFFKDSTGMPLVVQDKWARPQQVYLLFAADMGMMRYKLNKLKDKLNTTIYNAEIASYSKRLFKNKVPKNPKFKEIKKELGMGVAIGDKFELMKSENGFIWYAERYEGEQLGILCYKIPYTDTLQFGKEYLFRLRDSMLKENVPGPQEGSFMTTSASDLYPRFIEGLEVNGRYAKKLRGWWTVHGEFMGGPFVMYAVLSSDGTEIFVYEGFVYAPNKSKSKNLRTLEAVGMTVQ